MSALITPAELAARLGDPALRVFDTTVRLPRPPGGGPYTPESGQDVYDRGHVPGAGFADLVGDLAEPGPLPFALPSPERFADAAGRLGMGPGTHVVVYAQESPMWATRMWWLLRYFGFDAVSVLDGGLPAWRAAGLPLETGTSAYPAAPFTARPRPELLARRADVERIVADGSSCLANALAPEVFRGEGKTSYSRPGRIPGSVNAPAKGLLDADGNFLPTQELTDRLGGLLAEPSVVVYCGGGISATIPVFALALLGRTDARLYDGSLAEWSADPALPLETG
ncbi:thiosulfate/3-mercaptopyruvate sulfurtransferase [Actinocorallia herbida]|uniref:Thiosulfate/3-mercaptopyruvate sulfurtransferase n=1 Tax=Actinocorallia herbida TaxID=58109 RepID=A0A3N1D3N1_9ACTN|nr:sulfurtransferase [Actinocorallia herbida]ROO88135.1 thiosulfate/3-mercaptopyruvate sulfurtransferase [Actinocorallia herbida]